MNPKRIVIDGKTYNSVDEMPEEVRRSYEEAMRNFGAGNAGSASNAFDELNRVFADNAGDDIPDVMQNAQTINLSGGMKFVVDGKVYDSSEELPPQARAKYEQAMGSIDTDRNGVPDFLEGAMNVSAPASAEFEKKTSRPIAPLTGSPAVAPDTSSGMMLAVGAVFLLLLCAIGAAGFWYFFLR